MYGHIYHMSGAVVEGAREVDGAEVSLYEVAEVVPEEAVEKIGARAARSAFGHVPVATAGQLADTDAIIRAARDAPNLFRMLAPLSAPLRWSVSWTRSQVF
jgi:multimeric flavodoxin WrbA